MIYRDMLDTGYINTTLRALQDFGPVIGSLLFVPEYPGVLHALAMWGSPALDQSARTPLNRVQLRWCSEARPDLAFYDPRNLAFHLYLPPLFRRNWNGSLR
jgi:hypothetical protein